MRWLLILNFGFFVLQSLLDRLSGGQFSAAWGISVQGLFHGHLWQLLTYQFLHGNVGHLLLNMLCLFFLGPEVERATGARHFLIIYLLSGLLGGAGWLALTYPAHGYCVGASGSIFGVISAFAVLFPRRQVTLLVLLVLPVTLQAWKLAALLAVIQLLFLVSPETGGIAFSAHLIGGLVGFVYTMIVFRGGFSSLSWAGLRGSRDTDDWRATKPPRDDVSQEEVDRILDKIATQGIQSLSQRERDLLERASGKMRTRR